MADKTPVQTHEKWLDFQVTHPYETLGSMDGNTRRVWVVFHGIGFLSRYFLRYFEHLDPAENYIIAPQAPSLYYLDKTYRHVGASWLTREHTMRNMENLLAYLEALWSRESLDQAPGLVLMGYSQGVSVLCRWVALRKKVPGRIILYGGRVPEGLSRADFGHLPQDTPVEVFEGDADLYLPGSARQERYQHLEECFGHRLKMQVYEGGHELRPELIKA